MEDIKFNIILATDSNYGISKQNNLPWKISEDLKYFNKVTSHFSFDEDIIRNTVIMGYNTVKEIGKPLPNRTNIIISRSDLNIEGTYCFKSIDEGISFAKSQNESELFIIGGDSIYQQSMDILDTVYLTRIHHSFEADAFFPALQEEYWQLNQNEFHAADEKNKFDFSFQTYNRK